ncbi:MAG: lipocalin-like domain-containing protein [Gemmatimonadetes bacterium]|nr:lipocalin-like domain-containing protein [Gemmatimonadota bacterium]
MASLIVAAGALGGRYLLADAAVPVVRAQTTALIGTWRLVEFWDRETPSSRLVYRYGQKPTGYFTYDPDGHGRFRSCAARAPSAWIVPEASSGSRRRRLKNPRATEDYRAYFGTYVVDGAERCRA